MRKVALILFLLVINTIAAILSTSIIPNFKKFNLSPIPQTVSENQATKINAELSSAPPENSEIVIVDPSQLRLKLPTTNPDYSIVEESRRKFNDLKQRTGKSYSTQEQQTYRYLIFVEKLKMIDQFNAQDHSYKKGINQFSDWTHEQFVGKMLMKNIEVPSIVSSNLPQLTLKFLKDVPVPTTFNANPAISDINRVIVDWTSRRKVGRVKNQGKSCQAGWAFAVIGTIESNLAIKLSASPKRYSEQQLIDCCGVRGFMCDGCDGHTWPGSAYNYIASAGLANQSSYPYSEILNTCADKLIETPKYLKTTPSHFQLYGKGQTLKFLLKGPLTVLVDSTNWDVYGEGLYNECVQPVTYSHAVVLVGVDSLGNWKIRNSWGLIWGQLGYMRIKGDRDCGLTKYPLSPNLL